MIIMNAFYEVEKMQKVKFNKTKHLLIGLMCGVFLGSVVAANADTAAAGSAAVNGGQTQISAPGSAPVINFSKANDNSSANASGKAAPAQDVMLKPQQIQIQQEGQSSSSSSLLQQPTTTNTANNSAASANTATPTPSQVASSVPSLVPAPPDFDLKAYILIDANSGAVIAEKNADMRLPQASLTKLTSLYLIANALKTGQLHMNDQVPISENAWRVGGSRMFIKVGSTVPVHQLINGVVIASGNDSTVAMAEFLAGSEQTFVKIMNQVAAQLGMKNTSYSDSNGLPADNHYSSARDLAILAHAWIRDFPKYYSWFGQKWFTFNNIKQPNRNRLLWRDPSADGMKTGHTSLAGYCLVGSAVRNGTRLIAVILGAPNDSGRFNDAEALLTYGFRFFETHKVFAANQSLTSPRVLFGKANHVDAGVLRDFYVTVPVNQYGRIKVSIELPKKIVAPLKKGQAVGVIKAKIDGKVVANEPLLALTDVPEAGIFGKTFDYFVAMMH
jgi:D-alanyl-D-alanine carboxypeptidase (penicillin-binding protein 5/6)